MRGERIKNLLLPVAGLLLCGATSSIEPNREAMKALEAGMAVCALHELPMSTPSLWWSRTAYDPGYELCDKLAQVLKGERSYFDHIVAIYEQQQIREALDAVEELK